MIDDPNRQAGFRGLRVLSLESRRAKEMAQLIANNGGRAVVAPATREVPAKDNGDVAKFAGQRSDRRSI
jgi:uroporphyrinogen-III synthase